MYYNASCVLGHGKDLDARTMFLFQISSFSLQTRKTFMS